jgi:predicted HicB family RNase H-like nuclease
VIGWLAMINPVSIRINPEAIHLAKVEAVKEMKSLGAWLEEAIREKIQRSKRNDHAKRAG